MNTGCFRKKSTSLKQSFSKSRNVTKINSFTLERGKANLNFDVSYFKFGSHVQEILRKNKKFLF